METMQFKADNNNRMHITTQKAKTMRSSRKNKASHPPPRSPLQDQSRNQNNVVQQQPLSLAKSRANGSSNELNDATRDLRPRFFFSQSQFQKTVDNKKKKIAAYNKSQQMLKKDKSQAPKKKNKTKGPTTATNARQQQQQQQGCSQDAPKEKFRVPSSKAYNLTRNDSSDRHRQPQEQRSKQDIFGIKTKMQEDPPEMRAYLLLGSKSHSSRSSSSSRNSNSNKEYHSKLDIEGNMAQQEDPPEMQLSILANKITNIRKYSVQRRQQQQQQPLRRNQSKKLHIDTMTQQPKSSRMTKDAIRSKSIMSLSPSTIELLPSDLDVTVSPIPSPDVAKKMKTRKEPQQDNHVAMEGRGKEVLPTTVRSPVAVADKKSTTTSSSSRHRHNITIIRSRGASPSSLCGTVAQCFPNTSSAFDDYKGCSDATSHIDGTLLEWTEVCKDMQLLRDDLFRSMEDFLSGWDDRFDNDDSSTLMQNDDDGDCDATYITDATSAFLV